MWPRLNTDESSPLRYYGEAEDDYMNPYCLKVHRSKDKMRGINWLTCFFCLFFAMLINLVAYINRAVYIIVNSRQRRFWVSSWRTAWQVRLKATLNSCPQFVHPLRIMIILITVHGPVMQCILCSSTYIDSWLHGASRGLKQLESCRQSLNLISPTLAPWKNTKTSKQLDNVGYVCASMWRVLCICAHACVMCDVCNLHSVIDFE